MSSGPDLVAIGATLAAWGEVNQTASSVYTGVLRLVMALCLILKES